MSFIAPQKLRIDPVHSCHKFHTTVDVLRLDLVHPLVSGNKWFKLKYYLEDAAQQQKKIIASYGGAWSNHIHALAAACNSFGFQSIGIIRGERSETLSPTLQDAEAMGMKLYFLSREEYRIKKIPSDLANEFDPDEIYFIPEGGYGNLGARGASEILTRVETKSYTHILCAVGTGTTLAGLIRTNNGTQELIGISVLKNNHSIEEEISSLLPIELRHRYKIFHDYHFGGYAKCNNELLRFMKEWERETAIPLDFVYTAKLFYAVSDLLQKNYFPENSKILLIHTGGLQGNRGLHGSN
ncbi:MAG: 1-aminocyclopropane-1-carboxylate deaminase/D-cysteine desulfhydrase [Flavisolibacter sp.]